MATDPGTYRVDDHTAVPMDDAKAAWASVAHEILRDVAGEYHGLIYYGDLAEQLQERSGIRTRMLMHHWIGDVLGMVSRECFARHEPLLSSLCVHQDGTIGKGYGWVLGDTYGEESGADLDLHAAEERLKCYEHFGAVIPAGGGQPALPPQLAARRRAAAKRAHEERPRPVCPNCHLTLPLAGACDNCG